MGAGSSPARATNLRDDRERVTSIESWLTFKSLLECFRKLYYIKSCCIAELLHNFIVCLVLVYSLQAVTDLILNKN